MDPYRLPQTAVPRRYDLRLEPDLASASFTGEVDIHLLLHEELATLVLNAAELDVFDARAQYGPDWFEGHVALEPSTERCRVLFDQLLPAGEVRLHLGFRGTLNDKLRGFYRSKFKGPGGEERWLAATQFEATDARRAFPCWDEPAFKAVFSTTLVIDPALQAISNTAVAVERREGGKRLLHFADTIPLSTYLVAFIVGKLEASDAVLVGAAPVRVWCVPGKKRLTAFGHDVGVASLRFFEDYFDRKYPGDKLDLVAIPDFAAGAMENFGCITFRETALLVDEATATHQERERVADVVAHENAHMWFGDLVTMEWWNGLWLNEAFATFMEMLAVDHYRPAWQRWTTFGVSRSAALNIDGLNSSRPIEFAVTAPQDAEAMFDVLTYEKGASVLRMLEQYMGPDVFRAGVRAYLRRHALGNTQTRDLWEALGGASRLPIPEVMDGWVFRPGYPLLSATWEGGSLVLRQQRFRYLPLGAEDLLWQVPVQVRVDTLAGTEVRRLLLDQREHRLALPADTRLVLVNEGGHGFYRVRYDHDLTRRLLDQLHVLAAIERFNLVNDAWAAVLAGLTPLADYLDLTARFRGERDRNVWSVILGSLATLARLIDEEDRPLLQALVRDRLAPALAELGWEAREGEDELTGQLRADLLRAAGTLGDDSAVQATAARDFAANGHDAGVQAAVVAILAHTGDAARYDDFLARFRAAATPQEEQRYLLALAAFRPEALVERTLHLALEGVRAQDAPFLLRALLLGTHSRARAWAFFQANWERMSQAFPGPGIRRLCEGVLGLVSPEWEREVSTFFRDRKISLGGKTLEQFLEQLHVLVRLKQRAGSLHDDLRRVPRT
jgi:puromycin-sensitive aminopeptidase